LLLPTNVKILRHKKRPPARGSHIKI